MTDEKRIDGRELAELDEPGSDERLSDDVRKRLREQADADDTPDTPDEQQP